MKMSWQRATLLAMWCVILPVAAHAADSTLVLVLGGEAYDGPPRFEVDFGGTVLGEGSVAAAIDTATAGRFESQQDKTPYVQTFTFAIPEASFRPDGDVTVKFLNEAYGGPGSDRDRNLYVASVTLNGRAVSAEGLTSREGDKVVANQLAGEYLVIPDGSRNAVSVAPEGGWPKPLVAVAQPVAAPAAAPQPVAAAAPAAPTEAATPAAEIASLDPQPASANCDLNEKYNVIGFNSNSNDLTPRLIERLDQIAADIGARQCNVTVTGYSSKQGSIAANALFAIERAQNSLTYLQRKGVKFIKASATGVGATDEFGPDFATNRRVVITVTP